MNDLLAILITGGAGFVDSNLAVLFRGAFEGLRVMALDNLKRRGSELNLPRLKESGVEFFHGDIRCEEDLAGLPDFNLLIDCSAEPSVQAGIKDSPLALMRHNLMGTINLMELARRRHAAFLFLSTSRVYPIADINRLSFDEHPTRFVWRGDEALPGYGPEGIAENFPLDGARSFYGATKLTAELLLKEYACSCGMPVLINRCGLLTGPWQMGKVDQGVVALWVARHIYGNPLSYIGFGGLGKQVRDMLHIRDLFDLLCLQIETVGRWQGDVYNVGGGKDVSASLLEMTAVCRQVTGCSIAIRNVEQTSPVDVRIFITDSARARKTFGWKPKHSVVRMVEDIHAWIALHQERLRPILG